MAQLWRVTVWELSGTPAEERIVGYFVCDGTRVWAEPDTSRTLRWILDDHWSVLINGQPRMFTAATDPDLFIQQIYRALTGTRLCASEPVLEEARS